MYARGLCASEYACRVAVEMGVDGFLLSAEPARHGPLTPSMLAAAREAMMAGVPGLQQGTSAPGMSKVCGLTCICFQLFFKKGLEIGPL